MNINENYLHIQLYMYKHLKSISSGKPRTANKEKLTFNKKKMSLCVQKEMQGLSESDFDRKDNKK